MKIVTNNLIDRKSRDKIELECEYCRNIFITEKRIVFDKKKEQKYKPFKMLFFEMFEFINRKKNFV